MRIIGGKYKNYKIWVPKKMPYTRPTTDFAKEGLFNILTHKCDFSNLSVLDLFGGTGSISLEFLSRGVKYCTTIEKDFIMYKHIQNQYKKLSIENAKCIQIDAVRYLKFFQPEFNIAFAGPPYKFDKLDKLPEYVFTYSKKIKDIVFILEHNSQYDFSNHLYFMYVKKYGDTFFTFFQRLEKE